MKTKHILTALALPVMFAACTADEFEGVNALQQGERAKLSKNFVLNTNNGVESRYSVEGTSGLKFNFEEGDLIGANLVDQFVPGEEDPAKWDIIYSVNPALPFKNIGLDQWKSDSELGVGNYLFTYPYNKKDNNRAAAIYELSAIQDLKAGDLNAAIEAGNKAVGAVVLYEGQTSADINMKNLFTYPKLVLTFDNGENVTMVNKVALKGKFVTKAGYNHKKVAALFADNYDGFADEASEERAKILWEVKEGDYNKDKHTLNWDLVQTTDFLTVAGDANFDEAKKYGEPEVSDFLIAELDQKVTTDAAGNKVASVRLMMPSIADFYALSEDENQIKVYAYTDNGVYEKLLRFETCEFKSTTSETAIKNALQRSRTNTLTLKNMVKSDKDANNIVTTVADWNKLVATYGSNESYDGTTEAKTISVAVIGNGFAFNEEANMPSKAIFKVTTDFAIEGEVALNNLMVDGDITVKKGATLNIGEDFVANKIINKGNLNVNVEANISGIDNEGTLVVKKNGKLVASVSRATTNVVVNNKGVMTVEEGADVKAAINNLATLNVNGYVNATVVNGKAEAKKEENAKAIITMGATEKAILKGSVTNHGVINTAKDATIVVNDNKNEVVYVDGAKLTCTTGIVSYVSEETSFGAYYFADADGKATKKSCVNKLILTKDATFAGTATGKSVNYAGKTIVLKDGVDITVTEEHTLTLGTLEVEGQSTIAEGGNITLTNLNVVEGGDLISNAAMTATDVEVEEDAYFTVAAALTADTFKNEGSVVNNSTISVRTGGVTGEGKWSGDAVNPTTSKAEDAFDEELEVFVKTFIDYTNGITWTNAAAEMKNITSSSAKDQVKAKITGLINKYNAWKGTQKSDSYATLTEIMTELETTKVAAKVTSVKTTAISNVKTLVSNRVAATNLDGTLVMDYSWKNTNGYYKLAEKYGVASSLEQMWDNYKTYLLNRMSEWSVKVNNVETYPNTKDGSKTGDLLNTIKLSLASIIDAANLDADYVNADGETITTTPSTPDLAIPAGSYIDASNVEGAEYIVVKTWKNFEAISVATDHPLYTLSTYTKAAYDNATTPSIREYIANWCFELNRVKEENLSLEQSKAKKAISEFVDTVTEDWSDKTGQSDLNLAKLLQATF